MFKLSLNEFSDFFQIPFNLLSFTGLRFDFGDNKIHKRWRTIAYRILFIYVVLTFNLNVTSLILSLCFMNRKIAERITFISLLCSTIENTLKTFCLFNNSKIILKILKDLKKCYKPKCRYLFKEAKIILNFTKAVVIIPIIFALIPGFATIFIYIVSGKWAPVLINKRWYPFDAGDVRFYFFVFMSQYSWGIFAVSFLMGSDSTILMLYAHINQQLILLAEEFAFKKTYEIANLKIIVRRHRRIIE